MAEFPEKAKVVIIGLGGIVGASVAHHLIERGWDDIVGIDKSAIPTDIGSTSRTPPTSATRPATISCPAGRRSTPSISSRRWAATPRSAGSRSRASATTGGWTRSSARSPPRKAFGTGARLVGPAEIKEKFPLVEEEPGAGRHVGSGCRPRRAALADGRRRAGRRGRGQRQAAGLRQHAGPGLIVEDGRIKGVKTHRGTIMADHVVVCAGLWGRLIAEMVGRGPAGHAGRPPADLLRAVHRVRGHRQGHRLSAAARPGQLGLYARHRRSEDAEGGQIEWGYYEETNPRLCHPRDILEKDQARLSPSQRDLDMEQVIEPLERAMELTPILANSATTRAIPSTACCR
jgi:glycine/D-amino acid oxidase-like deaminating enzyme